MNKENITSISLNEQQQLAVYYYAALNEQDVVIMVVSLPVPISDPKYIQIASDDQSLVGKWYNRATGEFEDAMHFYAVLDDRDIVTDVVALPSQVTDEKMILISSFDQSLIGKWYNRGTGEFTEVPIHVLAKASTGEINTLNPDGTPKNEWLSTKLNDNDGKLSLLQAGVGGFKKSFNIRHNELITHGEYSIDDGKQFTFHFSTGIPGYFPKKVRLYKSLFTDSNIRKQFFADIYIVRNANGSIRSHCMETNYIGTYEAGGNFERIMDFVDSDPALSSGHSNGKYYEKGGGYFIQSYSTPTSSVEVYDFVYDENSLNFKMFASGGAIGKYTDIDFDVYVY